MKLPTIWTNGKAEVGRVKEEKRREEKRRDEKRRDETRREEKRRDETRRDEKRREEKRRKKREDQRRERVRRKKMQVRKKVEKSRFTVFFRWFVAPENRKLGSLKRRVRSHLARWEMKNCTPLWREAHLEVKLYKARQLRTTFGTPVVLHWGNPDFSQLNFYEAEFHGFYFQAKSPGTGPSGANAPKFS